MLPETRKTMSLHAAQSQSKLRFLGQAFVLRIGLQISLLVLFFDNWNDLTLVAELAELVREVSASVLFFDN